MCIVFCGFVEIVLEQVTSLRIQWKMELQIACKKKEDDAKSPSQNSHIKKPRLVFTDLQRRTLHAIFKENKRPSKEMQITISQQLGLELSTVSNFFMNARRRSQDKWQDEMGGVGGNVGGGGGPGAVHPNQGSLTPKSEYKA
nr:hepatocyte nuclear factor 6-like [Lytechinus pictus]